MKKQIIGNSFGKCFECEFCKQTENCMQCVNPNKITFIKLKRKCECGRFDPLWFWKLIYPIIAFFKPASTPKACGKCVGRGSYCYPNSYDDCDCGYYKKSTN